MRSGDSPPDGLRPLDDDPSGARRVQADGMSLRFEHGRLLGSQSVDVLGVQADVEVVLAELSMGAPTARARVYFRPPPSPLRDAARSGAAKLLAPAELTEAELAELDAAVDLAWARHCADGSIELPAQIAMNAMMLLMGGFGGNPLPGLPAQAYVDRFTSPPDGDSPFRLMVGAWLDRGVLAARRALAWWGRPVAPGTEAALARWIDEQAARWSPSGKQGLRKAIATLCRRDIGAKRADAEAWLGEDRWPPLKWRTALGRAGLTTGAWSSCAAVPRAVSGDVMSFVIDEQRHRSLDLPGMADGLIRGRDGKPVAEIENVAGTNVALIRDGVTQLGRPTGQRLLRHVIHRTFDQYQAGKVDGVLHWPGGLSELRGELGISHNQLEELTAAVHAGPLSWFFTLDGLTKVGGLWTFILRHRGPLWITAGAALRPGVALEARLRNPRANQVARRQRTLIPELRGDVAAGALAPSERGAAWRLHRLVMLALVDNARDLAELGGATLDDAWWAANAIRAGVPDRRLDRLLGSWRDGEGDIVPMLKLSEGGVWTLADDHAAERDFIEAWGRRQLAGDRAGRASARARAARPGGKPSRKPKGPH